MRFRRNREGVCLFPPAGRDLLEKSEWIYPAIMRSIIVSHPCPRRFGDTIFMEGRKDDDACAGKLHRV
jgi:hypothetical protein